MAGWQKNLSKVVFRDQMHDIEQSRGRTEMDRRKKANAFGTTKPG